MKLLRQIKYRTSRRFPKRTFFLHLGPMSNEKIRLSYSGSNTLIFTLKGNTGRYAAGFNNKELTWEPRDYGV